MAMAHFSFHVTHFLRKMNASSEFLKAQKVSRKARKSTQCNEMKTLRWPEKSIEMKTTTMIVNEILNNKILNDGVI